MRSTKFNRFWFMLTVLAIAALACYGNNPPVQPTTPNPPVNPQNIGDSNDGLSQSERLQLISATVQIFGLFDNNGELVPGYTGSGTIISSTGMILTNAHVASPASQGDVENEPKSLGIALVESEDRPPTPSYFAQVLAVDGYLDLAVIQITSTVDGANIDTSSLNLPYVSLGDSDQIHVGDHVNIFGFPGIGGDTITYTDGNVSGFTSEEQIGDRAWVKTDATIAGGNSGGLAADDSGRIIGVPTQASSGGSGEVTDCRQIQDTNKDGIINENDSCIPIGGFINALRPVNLALPLIKAAQSGQQYSSPFGSNVISTSGSGSESFSNMTWYSVSGGSECKLGEPVSSYPSNTAAMAATFDFSGMTDGQEWAELWTADGQEVYSGSYAWTEGESGQSYTCIYATDGSLADGNYRLQLYAGADLPQLAESSVVVGGGSSGTNPPPASNGVAIYGTVTDADTGRTISDAQVFILQPGITYDQWSSANYPESNVYAYALTDANGGYEIPLSIARNEEYTIVASAQGYYDRYGDLLVWTDEDPDRYQLDIQMTK
ncbi:MAG: trypsin-like peptidase domain-containing protein [Chloroflexi bacterium]|nr:trypsin-like peptidase domain-containing protein [Chloroflexota bacterium]